MKKIRVPFHEHDFSGADIRAATQTLKKKWITGGPENIALEEELARFIGAPTTVALNSATAGLFLSLKLFGIRPGDEVITSPYSFVATANVICACGADPIFADIGPDYNLDPESVMRKVTPRTKAIIAVDYGGYPCDYHSLKKTSIPFRPTHPFQEALGRPLILADSAHSIGTVSHSHPGPRGHKSPPKRSPYADIHVYSFHAVKNITCGEGGAVGFLNPSLIAAGMVERMQQARLHGMNHDAYHRENRKTFFYDVEILGYKYNLSEMAAALARSQLKRIHGIEKKKNALKEFYDRHFQNLPGIKLRPQNPKWTDWRIHPHLYTLEWEGLTLNTIKQKENPLTYKEKFFRAADQAGVSLNFHYPPIPLLTYYQRRGYSLNQLPVTRALYPRHFSLPFYPSLTRAQASAVVSVITRLTGNAL